MDAKKCDRCGALFECVNHDFSDLRTFRYYKIQKEVIPDIYTRFLDLCPKCQEGLRKWVEFPQKGEQ
jgi:ribosomal protein S27AE